LIPPQRQITIRGNHIGPRHNLLVGDGTTHPPHAFGKRPILKRQRNPDVLDLQKITITNNLISTHPFLPPIYGNRS